MVVYLYGEHPPRNGYLTAPLPLSTLAKHLFFICVTYDGIGSITIIVDGTDQSKIPYDFIQEHFLPLVVERCNGKGATL